MDKFSQRQAEVGHGERTCEGQPQGRIITDSYIQILYELYRTLQECRGPGHVRDQLVGNAGKVYTREKSAGLGQFELKIESGIEFDDIENADSGIHPDTQRIARKIKGEFISLAAYGNIQGAAFHLAVIDIESRSGITAQRSPVQFEHEIARFQRQEGIGPHDTGKVCSCGHTVKINAGSTKAGCGGR